MRSSLRQLQGKQVEVDFGQTPTEYGVFVVIDSSVAPASRIHAVQSGNAATGGNSDDAEMDPILFSASAGSGQLTIAGRALDGAVVGRYTVDYLVG